MCPKAAANRKTAELAERLACANRLMLTHVVRFWRFPQRLEVATSMIKKPEGKSQLRALADSAARVAAETEVQSVDEDITQQEQQL